jgi:hypothetical protein
MPGPSGVGHQGGTLNLKPPYPHHRPSLVNCPCILCLCNKTFGVREELSRGILGRQFSASMGGPSEYDREAVRR